MCARTCARGSQDVINGKEHGSDRKPWKVRVRWRLCNCWQVCVNTFGSCSPNAAQRCDSRSVLCFIISISPCIIIEIVTFGDLPLSASDPVFLFRSTICALLSSLLSAGPCYRKTVYFSSAGGLYLFQLCMLMPLSDVSVLGSSGGNGR